MEPNHQRRYLWGLGHLAVGSLLVRFGTTPSLKKTPDHQHLSPWDQSQPPLIQKAQSSKVGAKRYTHIPTCKHAQTSHSKPGVPKVHTQPLGTTSIIRQAQACHLRFALPTGAVPTSPSTKTSRTKSPGPARRLSMKMKKLPELRRRLSLRSTRTARERERTAPAGSVISRYHLDSSVGTPGQASVAGGTRSPRGGYLSDGDSPERPGGPPSPTAFRPYEVGSSARAPPAALWGRLSLHLYGLGGLRPTPGATPRDLCCLLQVDGVARARTGPLRGGPDFLRLDHTFHLELEAARLLRALVLAWDPGVRRHRPCAQGTVLLPTIFRGKTWDFQEGKATPRPLTAPRRAGLHEGGLS